MNKCLLCNKPVPPSATKTRLFCCDAHKVKYFRVKRKIIREMQS